VRWLSARALFIDNGCNAVEIEAEVPPALIINCCVRALIPPYVPPFKSIDKLRIQRLFTDDLTHDMSVYNHVSLEANGV
jgi:hypothetical protein